MYNDKIMVKLQELKDFAEETEQQIQEYESYRELGILGEDIRETMEKNIIDRLAYTHAKLLEVQRAMFGNV